MLEALLQFALKLCPKPLQTLWYKYESVWRYCYYGAWTTLLSILTKLAGQWLFGLAGFSMEQKIPNSLNTAISWLICATFAFVVNKKYVFHSESTEKQDLFHEITTFFGARGLTFFLEWAIMLITTTIWHWNYTLMTVLVQFIILALNYIFSKLVVFKKGKTPKHSSQT